MSAQPFECFTVGWDCELLISSLINTMFEASQREQHDNQDDYRVVHYDFTYWCCCCLSLRAMFSDDARFNSIHGADSTGSAESELDYFFPVEQTVAVVKPDAVTSKGTDDTNIQCRFHHVAVEPRSWHGWCFCIADGTFDAACHAC